MLNEGDIVPDTTFLTGDGGTLSLSQLAKPVVIYFYPKDDTPGCTTEAKDFSHLKAAFDMAGVGLLGVSRDDARSHGRFADKHGLTIALATDDGAAGDVFGTWGEKQMYGKTYMGTERATFLIDADGRLARSWRKVKVPGHAEAVLAAAQALTGDRPH